MLRGTTTCWRCLVSRLQLAALSPTRTLERLLEPEWLHTCRARRHGRSAGARVQAHIVAPKVAPMATWDAKATTASGSHLCNTATPPCKALARYPCMIPLSFQTVEPPRALALSCAFGKVVAMLGGTGPLLRALKAMARSSFAFPVEYAQCSASPLLVSCEVDACLMASHDFTQRLLDRFLQAGLAVSKSSLMLLRFAPRKLTFPR